MNRCHGRSARNNSVAFGSNIVDFFRRHIDDKSRRVADSCAIRSHSHYAAAQKSARSDRISQTNKTMTLAGVIIHPYFVRKRKKKKKSLYDLPWINKLNCLELKRVCARGIFFRDHEINIFMKSIIIIVIRVPAVRPSQWLEEDSSSYSHPYSPPCVQHTPGCCRFVAIDSVIENDVEWQYPDSSFRYSWLRRFIFHCAFKYNTFLLFYIFSIPFVLCVLALRSPQKSILAVVRAAFVLHFGQPDVAELCELTINKCTTEKKTWIS